MSVEFSKQMEKLPALSTNEEEFRVHRIESVLREMDSGGGRKFSNLHTKIRRLLKKYKERKAYEQERRSEWELINQQKPNSETNHPDDVKAILECEQTIGDYKLKLDEDYVPPEGDSLLLKSQEILEVQERIYEMKKAYNEEIFQLRVKKEELLEKIKRDVGELKRIHGELPERMRREMVEFNDFDEDVEFPEKFLGIDRVKREKIDEICEGTKSGILDRILTDESGEFRFKIRIRTCS